MKKLEFIKKLTALIIVVMCLTNAYAQTPKKMIVKVISDDNGVITTKIDTTFSDDLVNLTNIDSIVKTCCVKVEVNDSILSGKNVSEIINNGSNDSVNIQCKIIMIGDSIQVTIDSLLNDMGISNRNVVVKQINCGGELNEKSINDIVDSKKHILVKRIIKMNKNSAGNAKVNVDELNEADINNLKKNILGIDMNNLEIKELNISPNPNNGSFNLSFTLSQKSDVSIDIYDLNGKFLFHDEIVNFNGKYSNDLNLQGKNKGTFLLRVKAGSKFAVKKIVIE